MLSDAWAAIQEMVSIALTALSEDIIKPLLNALGTWWNTKWTEFKTLVEGIFTAMKAAIELKLGEIKAAIETKLGEIKGIWDTAWGAMQGAIEGVATGLNTALTGALDAFRKYMQETFGPAMATIKANFIDPIVTAFWDIVKAVQGVIGIIDDLINKMKGIHIPNPFQPGSPSPFELSLRGIADAMREISTLSVPQIGFGNVSAPNFTMPNAQQVTGVTAATQGGNNFDVKIYHTQQDEASLADDIRFLNFAYGGASAS
jgi:hypothetical protein